MCTCKTLDKLADRPREDITFDRGDCDLHTFPDAAAFVTHFLPVPTRTTRIRVQEFLGGTTHSAAIEAALAAEVPADSFRVLVLDAHDWIIDRAILLPSNTELVIDGCTLKLADGVFDNIIRVAGLQPNPSAPAAECLAVTPTVNFKITGVNGAVIAGTDHPFAGINPKTGVHEPWVGDFYGWRTVGILLSAAERYELSGFTMQRTQCWAISQDQCRFGCLHDLTFHTNVKNGDGIDFRNGCAYCWVEAISGSTSDDTVACTALDGSYETPTSKYIFPMQPMGMRHAAATGPDIHDLVIRRIHTSGLHHAVICLATSPSVYNIHIADIQEPTETTREACVKIYTGYGTGYTPGNLRHITVNHVVAHGARYAVMVKAAVKHVHFSAIRQRAPGAAQHHFEGDSEDLSITPEPT